jgi:nucleoside-diphosphate-sugar epimerase
MAVLVTGALGVIGQRLTTKLRERGYDTVISDVKILKQDGYRRGDITQYVEMDRIFKEFNVEHVFHLAGEVGRVNGEEFPRRAVDINVSGTINLAQLCLEHGAKLYFASTSEVYSGLPGHEKLTEDLVDVHGYAPTNVYGISKWHAEHYLRHFFEYAGLKALSFRFFMCYGEGEYPNPYRSAMTNFVYAALTRKQLNVHRGTARSWCYIDDIVAGCIAAMENAPFKRYEAYNIGRDDLRPTEEVAELIVKLTGADPEQLVFSNPDRLVYPVKDASFEKARRDLGWESTIPLEEGIKRTIAWQKRELHL